MDNFTDAAGEIMWDEEEKKAREDNKVLFSFFLLHNQLQNRSLF
jgi:hypothetical protein